MIVTRSWLEEYIDLSDISNDELVSKLNSIGLEVDSVKEIEIPKGVVVGEIVSCGRHPDADKLSLCSVDVGGEILQIVCGAKNVVDARFVAVAKIGAILPDNFKIKKARLRGVESFGMVCSSTEIGLPETEDGIMILDDSIGELIVGKELNEYKKVADTVIEIELTANRGDCLSIYGVARDLAAAFKKELIPFEFENKQQSKIAIAREVGVELKRDFDGVIEYSVALIESMYITLLHRLRIGFAQLEFESSFDKIASYAAHSSGVILRGYDFNKLEKSEDGKVEIEVVEVREGVVEVKNRNNLLSIVGVNQSDEFKVKDTYKILLEASYINPELVVEGVNSNKLKSDHYYYNSSRGSEPDVGFGIRHLHKALQDNSTCIYSKSPIAVGKRPQSKIISMDFNKINSIIGQNISKSEIANILLSLGFSMNKIEEDRYAINVPPYRHDIKNVYDIAEEVMRIYGIDNIQSKPLSLLEKNRITPTYLKFRAKEQLVHRAISASFHNVITYAFANRKHLLKYGFKTVDSELDLINPMVNELNTLRTTILMNLIEAVSRNVKYGKKSISLFEIGTVFDSKREEREVVSFIFSGEDERANVRNSAKAKMIEFSSFVDKISSVIGEFELIKTTPDNGLIHPYVSAKVVKDGKEIGFISKIHPKAVKDFDIYDGFIAEFNLEDVIPKHKNAKALSNYQPVTKDLSVVLDKSFTFYEIGKILKEFQKSEPILRDFYPLDLYEDESLGDKKSLTIRFTLQSDSKTLSDKEIESVMSFILTLLENSFGAKLR